MDGLLYLQNATTFRHFLVTLAWIQSKENTSDKTKDDALNNEHPPLTRKRKSSIFFEEMQRERKCIKNWNFPQLSLSSKSLSSLLMAYYRAPRAPSDSCMISSISTQKAVE